MIKIVNVKKTKSSKKIVLKITMSMTTTVAEGVWPYVARLASNMMEGG